MQVSASDFLKFSKRGLVSNGWLDSPPSCRQSLKMHNDPWIDLVLNRSKNKLCLDKNWFDLGLVTTAVFAEILFPFENVGNGYKLDDNLFFGKRMTAHRDVPKKLTAQGEDVGWHVSFNLLLFFWAFFFRLKQFMRIEHPSACGYAGQRKTLGTRCNRPADPEIRYFQDVGRRNQHIFWFNISMDKILRVNVLQSVSHLHHPFDFGRHWASVLFSYVVSNRSHAELQYQIP